jgi:hypothetical protein
MIRFRLGIGLGLVSGLVLPASGAAQFTEVPPPAAYAVQGATVIRPDGPRVEGVTVVIRGPLIEAIGADVEIPGDALLLPGDSVFVYPGLVDAEGGVGYEFPEQDFDRSRIESWDPPRELQGFMPQRRVLDHLELDGDDLESQRLKGVVAAAVHPANALMPGRGTLLLFRPDAEEAWQMVVTPTLGPVMAFRSGRGVYPSQLFGLMAFFRQQFADAERQARLSAAYRQNPRGMSTPAWDPAFEVIRDVQSGATSVFFRADLDEDIRRALQLGDELGFSPIIVGGDEAWKLAPELARRDVPVLVSLDFPLPERWDPTEDEREEAEAEPPPEEEGPAAPDQEPTQEPTTAQEVQEPATAQEAQEPTTAQEAQEEELDDPAVWRERKRLEDIYANAAKLAEAGVRFALTSGGGGADLIDGARKAIEYGLPGDIALRALTTAPAEIYGVPYLSNVDPGYPATLIVTDRPLFDDGARVLYAFVEGVLQRVEASGAGGGESAAVDLTGTWGIEITAGEGFVIRGTMTLVQEGDSFEGEMDLDMGTGTVRSGTVSGSDIRFVVSIGGGEGTATFTGTVEGDQASGDGSSEDFSLTWKANRRPGGDR